MRLLKKFFKKDNKGLSLVELICAVAILGAVSTAIGGAMIVSSDSYRRGTTEANLQKSAQFTANVIEGLVIDATKDVTFDASTNTLTVDNAEVGHTYTIALNAQNELVYTDSAGGSEVIATGVTHFYVDTTEFDAHRNLQVELKMSDGNKDISTVYNVTSRNNKKASVLADATPSATVNVASVVVLEPKQTYLLPVTVNTSGGASSDYSVTTSNKTSLGTSAVKDGDNLKITLGEDETGTSGEFLITITPATVNSTTGMADTKTIRVLVRRVTAVDIALKKISGDDCKENAVYQVKLPDTASGRSIVGTNLDYVSGTPSDSDYDVIRDTVYGATWELKISDGYTFSEYVSIEDQQEGGTSTVPNPYVTFKLKKDLPLSAKITITATAKHPEGKSAAGVRYNKTTEKYDTVVKSVVLENSLRPYLDGNFLRGDDFVKLKEPAGYWEYRITNAKKNPDGSAIAEGNYRWRYIRYCPAVLKDNGEVDHLTGTWSSWQAIENGDSPGFTPVRPGALNLNPMVDYAVEIRFLLGKSDGTILWPADWVGSGDTDTPHTATNVDDYTFGFTVPAVTLYFDYWKVDWPAGTHSLPVGTMGIPRGARMIVQKDTMYYFHFDAISAHVSKFFKQNDQMIVRAQREIATDVWQDVSIEQVLERDGEQTGFLKFCARQPGIYRLEIDWSNNWQNSNLSTLWGHLDYPNTTNGRGIFYFEVLN